MALAGIAMEVRKVGIRRAGVDWNALPSRYRIESGFHAMSVGVWGRLDSLLLSVGEVMVLVVPVLVVVVQVSHRAMTVSKTTAQAVLAGRVLSWFTHGTYALSKLT